jgi:anaerobic ribonucleoside-triphosphate reductase
MKGTKIMYNEIKDRNQMARTIIKRDGRKVNFEPIKIISALNKANAEAKKQQLSTLSEDKIQEIANAISERIFNTNYSVHVEEIQNMVEDILKKTNIDVFVLYHDYRKDRAIRRQKTELDKDIEKLLSPHVTENGVQNDDPEAMAENSNKNPIINSTMRDYIAGEWSRYYSSNYIFPRDLEKAHEEGLLHIHDMDYQAQPEHNCDLINLEDMLQNGTCISGTMIEKPKSFATACTVTSQISAAVASAQYGGQSITLSHLAPFVDVSRKKIREQVIAERKANGDDLDEEKIMRTVDTRLRKEIASGCQTIQYQEITLSSTNGQAPFITIFMYLNEVPDGQERDDLAMIIEEMLKQRIQGVKNKDGVWITPAFPKLIYVLEENNINPTSKYYYLTELAARCTAKRMVPDYVSEKQALNLKGDCYPPMGCRSFLTPDRFTDAGIGNIANAKNYIEGKHKYYGRFNQGVVTINLPYVAGLSGGDMDKFWEILHETEEMCHRALQIKHNRLMGTPSDVAPILWQDGALARLKPGEAIDKLLFNGYSTISLGYAGLYETVMFMKHTSHTTEDGKEFGLAVMQDLNDACAKWKKAENIDYSVYGTPMESTTYKFAKALKSRFGEIKDFSDHNYITNSYHICVREKIDAFDKLSKEAVFQKLSPGGAVSYVEVPNMQNNIPAVLAILKHIYNTILYAELNTKSDYCECCGFDGEMKIVEDTDGTLIWECPNCGNRNQDKMHVARRTCGYIGTNFWNQGRTQEIKDRVLHL